MPDIRSFFGNNKPPALSATDIKDTRTTTETPQNKAQSDDKPSEQPASKRQKSVQPESSKCDSGSPASIVCWNVNGLRPRLQSNEGQLANFLKAHRPDVLFLSEARLKAASPNNRGIIDSSDKKAREEKSLVEDALGRSTAGYHIKLSLASKRYAGTAILWRKDGPQPLRIWYDLPASLDDNPTRHHDVEGRIILAEWAGLLTLHTYTPNNGTKEESFK